MKIHPVRVCLLLAATLSFAPFARADETAYARILKQRDAILSELVAASESRATTGLADEESVTSARLALWSFRRDTAASNAEKIRQQELIVTALEKRLARIEGQAKTGIGTRETTLLATDALLQARQLLEELKSQPKKG